MKRDATIAVIVLIIPAVITVVSVIRTSIVVHISVVVGVMCDPPSGESGSLFHPHSINYCIARPDVVFVRPIVLL